MYYTEDMDRMTEHFEIDIPFEVEFIDDNCCSYTYGGKYNVKDASQTLFWQKFKIPEEAYIKPLSKLEVDTKVLVWRKGETEKHKRYFSHFDGDMIYCFGSGSSSWNSNGLTTHWSNWELYEDKQ